MASDELETFRARALSFGAAAAEYAAYRPGYPASALDWAIAPLVPHADGPVVLDLGAGTGRLAQSLDTRFNRVVAVEPDERMLKVLREQLPRVESLAGSAERIPMPDSSVDAVLVGQAFHWFDPELAAPEIARVLRHGGLLAALWNAEDDTVGWVADYHYAVFDGPRGNGVPAGRERADLPGTPYFGPTERKEFRHTHRLTVDGVINAQGTQSVTLLKEPADRERQFNRIRDYFAGRPELTDAPDAALDFPLRTMVFRALRLDARK